MSCKGDVAALRKAFMKQDDAAEICAVMGRAGLCRTNICAQVMNDWRNRPCSRENCERHALNPDWLAEARKLASLDRENSAEMQALGMPRPCLFYGKAACFVEKRMVTEEEMRTGVAKRPPRATIRTTKRSSRAPTRAPSADLSDALSEAPPSSTAPPSDTDERSLFTAMTETAPPSDTDERSLLTPSSAKTAETAETPELKQARRTTGNELEQGRHSRYDSLRTEKVHEHETMVLAQTPQWYEICAGEEEETGEFAATVTPSLEERPPASRRVRRGRRSKRASSQSVPGGADHKELTDEEWEVRKAKRTAFVAAITASSNHGGYVETATAAGETPKRLPDPEDRSISKRDWERRVMAWRIGSKAWNGTCDSVAGNT